MTIIIAPLIVSSALLKGVYVEPDMRNYYLINQRQLIVSMEKQNESLEMGINKIFKKINKKLIIRSYYEKN